MTERLTVKHTPTPWEVGEFKEQPYVCAEYGGRLVADTFGGTLEEAQANAALIVQAVKAYTDHQAVVAELEARLEKAEKDKAFYMNAAAEETDRHAKALDQLQQATEREAALRGYAQHKSTCRNWAEIGVCTCGLNALARNPKG